jgi:NAD(P)-dependent dehydrogenase (short-subunit alcohol dehydrogenase family)
VLDAELRNKTTVVTGAASGIGRELVLVLARGGARVLGGGQRRTRATADMLYGRRRPCVPACG